MTPGNRVSDPRSSASDARRGRARSPRVFGLLSLALLMVGGQAAPAASAAAPSFMFNWTGAPNAPQPWVPASMNDWDVLESAAGAPMAQAQGGTFQAGHGADCGAPPATHAVANLTD